MDESARQIATPVWNKHDGAVPEYNEKFPEPEKLIFELTGKPVSPAFANVVRRLEAGQKVSKEEYEAIPEIIDARNRIGNRESTININTYEREILRKNIANQLIEKCKSAVRRYNIKEGKIETVYAGPVRRERRVDIILGLPSSGKSSALVDPISYKYGSRLVDSDEAKKLIPEFDDGWGAGRVHNESTEIISKVLARSMSLGENLVIPKVGANYDQIAEMIDMFKEKGYQVHIHLNELDMYKAAGRNLRRFATDCRFVDLADTSYKFLNRPTEVFERLVSEQLADELSGREGKIDGYTRVSNDVKFGDFPAQLGGTETISFDWGDFGQGRGVVSKVSAGRVGQDRQHDPKGASGISGGARGRTTSGFRDLGVNEHGGRDGNELPDDKNRSSQQLTAEKENLETRDEKQLTQEDFSQKKEQSKSDVQQEQNHDRNLGREKDLAQDKGKGLFHNKDKVAEIRASLEQRFQDKQFVIVESKENQADLTKALQEQGFQWKNGKEVNLPTPLAVAIDKDNKTIEAFPAVKGLTPESLIDKVNQEAIPSKEFIGQIQAQDQDYMPTIAEAMKQPKIADTLAVCAQEMGLNTEQLLETLDNACRENFACAAQANTQAVTEVIKNTMQDMIQEYTNAE